MDLNTMLTVINEVGAYIYAKDLNGRYTYANRLVLELFEVSIDELVGKDDHEFFDATKVKVVLDHDKKVLAGEVVKAHESVITKKTRQYRHFLTVKKPLFNDKNEIVGMFGISTDITEQKKLQDEITEQKKFLDTILDNVDAFIYIKDKNRVFRYVNSKVAKLFGLPSKKIIGKRDTEVIPKEIADSFWKSDQEVLDTNSKVIIEEKFTNNEEDSYYYSVKLPYKLHNSEACIIGLSTDITSLKKQAIEIYEKDKILYQQAKNTALGEMIENIAHQWRQPLTVISSITTGIKLKKLAGVYDEKDLFDELQSITNSVNFLSETIDYFRGFMKKDNPKSYFKVEYIINKTLELILADLKNSNIEVVTKLIDLEIFSYKNEFIQILINLIKNSKDAFLESKIENKYIFIDTYIKDDKLIIEVSDNAGGVKEEYLDRIFEPYFTTKHQSQGTGIGLFMCSQIVEKSLEGTIEVKNKDFTHNNKPCKGACFTMNLTI